MKVSISTNEKEKLEAASSRRVLSPQKSTIDTIDVYLRMSEEEKAEKFVNS
jgi:hypothetical protein